MKKLMVLAVVACAAFCSQAAAVNNKVSTYYWNVANADGHALYLPSSSTPVNGTLYIINSVASDYTLDEAWAGIKGGTLTFSDFVANNDYAANVVDGVVAYESEAFTTSASSGGHEFYYALQNGDNYFFSSESIMGSKQPAGQDITFALGWSGDAGVNFGNKDWVDNGWYSTAAVPEPTSGLLLLLGVAGLALKRKRA